MNASCFLVLKKTLASHITAYHLPASSGHTHLHYTKKNSRVEGRGSRGEGVEGVEGVFEISENNMDGAL